MVGFPYQWLAVAIAVVSVLATVDSKVAQQTTRIEKNTRLAELTDRFFRWRLHEYPEYGTMFGLHDNDDRVEEFTEEAFSRQLQVAMSFLNETYSLDVLRLSLTDRLSLDALKYNLRTFIDGYPYRKYGMYNVITTLMRPPDHWSAIVQRMPLKTERDYQNLISRLHQLPIQVDQVMSMMRRAIALNVTFHNASLTGVLDCIDEVIVNETTVTSSQLYRDIFVKGYQSDGINETMRNSFLNQVRQMLLNEINDAWIRFRHFVANEYMPRTRPHIGVSSLVGGREFYDACLRWHTTTNVGAEEIHRTGLEEVNRIKGEMNKILAEQKFNETLRQFVASLYNNSENFYKTPEELLAGYAAIIDRVRGKLPLVLLKNPQVDIVVARSSNPHGPSGGYSDPSLDFSRPGEFIANVFHPESELKAAMTSLTLHEAEPGHHTQAIYNLMSDLPTFRRAIDYRKYYAVPFNWPFMTAYVEGWALYAETLGEEMGVYEDSLSLFGRYSSEMFRACRLVVDTGIHAFGWSKEKATEFFHSYTLESEESVKREIDRYISWPGQACAYKMGELTIKRIKNKAEARIGTRFDKRRFHDYVLDLGPLPLDLLEEYVDKWIDDVVASSTSLAAPTNTRHSHFIAWTAWAASVTLLSRHCANFAH